VNSLVGKQVAEEGGKKSPCTYEVTSYSVAIERVDIRVWDSPGLQDDIGKDEEYLAEIERKVTEELDLVIFCVNMDDTRLNRDKETFKILAKQFGKDLWKNAVMALTFANKVEDQDGGDRKAYFMQELANWREAIHSFLNDTLKLDPKLVQSLPLVPTGYY